MRGEARAFIKAQPELLYDLVADVRRMGEWSPICVGGEWVNATHAVPGARFRGRNKRGPVTWSTLNEVLVADRGRVFAWVTGINHEGGVTRWEYRFEPRENGTEVIESYEFTPEQEIRHRSTSGRIWGFLGRLIGETEAKTVRGMEETLRRLRRAAEDGATRSR